jgi:hypothetical protein
MPKSDAEHLAELRTWRDNLVAALETPETVSAFGGMPDAGNSGKIGRMGGRSQLLSELREIKAQIKELEELTENGPYLRESRGVT